MGEPSAGSKPEGEATSAVASSEAPKASGKSKNEDDGLKTPGQWFKELLDASLPYRDQVNALAEYNGAAAAHGWAEHAFHASKAIRLAKEDYLAALKGAASGKGADGIHRPALSEHAGKGT